MRIVTWNCNMALRLKFDRLLSLRPDVAIVQECADPDGANPWRPECVAYNWIGFNPDKGLGIFTFNGLTLTRHPGYAEKYALFLPVTISGWCCLNLLGVWVAAPRAMPAGATNDPLTALRYYRPFLSEGPSVVAGDFNRLPQQMSARRSGPGSAVLDTLAGAGLTNAEHVVRDATGRAMLRRTHYHRRKFSRGFVVDYTFIPAGWAPRLTGFEVGDPHDWIPWSDHVPLVAEFDDADSTTGEGCAIM